METTAYGDRIRAARILRGWKSVDLAEEMHWSPSRQTTIEQSETVQLETQILSLLAEKLKFPERFFTAQPSAALSPEELLFRAPVATAKSARKPTSLSSSGSSVRFWRGLTRIIGCLR